MSEARDTELQAKYARIVEIDKAIAALKDEKSDIETELGIAQTSKYAEISGVGRFERYRTTAKTTWDDNRLQAQCIRVAREQRIATDDGEIIEDPVERAVFVLSKAARFDWRVGDKKDRKKPGLATFGIDASDYREKQQGILKVKFVGADGGEG